MLFPTMATLVMRLTRNENPRIKWDRFPLKYIPIALLLMPVAMHAAMLPVTLGFEGHLPWFAWLTPQADGTYRTPSPLAWGDLTVGGLAGRIVANAAIGLAAVTILVLF